MAMMVKAVTNDNSSVVGDDDGNDYDDRDANNDDNDNDNSSDNDYDINGAISEFLILFLFGGWRGGGEVLLVCCYSFQLAARHRALISCLVL